MARELGKTLNELMGWPGPMTHLQFLCWIKFLDWGAEGAPAKKDEPFDPYFSAAEVAKRRAEVDEGLTVVPRGRAGGMDAGELLRAGVSRNDEKGRAMRRELGIREPTFDPRMKPDGC